MIQLKEWKKVILGIISIIILLFAVDRIVGNINKSLYNRSKYGIFGRQIYSLNECNEDIIILGSSRASHHYVPSIFTDSLDLSCYNCGSEGMCVYYHYGILSSLIDRGVKPKLVIYDVMDLDANVSDGPTFNLEAAVDRFAPHYGHHPSIDSLFMLKGWKEKIKLQSICYRYNSKLVQTIKCNYIPSKENNGYEAVLGLLPDTASFQIHAKANLPLDSIKIKYVNKLIGLSKEHNIPLILIQSPKYYQVESNGIDTIKAIAKEEEIAFLDFVNEQSLMKREYFRDNMHLNDYGAHVWSAFLASKLKELNQK